MIIGITKSGKSTLAEKLTNMRGFFNKGVEKETSLMWHYKITGPNDVAYKITEYDSSGKILNIY